MKKTLYLLMLLGVTVSCHRPSPTPPKVDTTNHLLADAAYFKYLYINDSNYRTASYKDLTPNIDTSLLKNEKDFQIGQSSVYYLYSVEDIIVDESEKGLVSYIDIKDDNLRVYFSGDTVRIVSKKYYNKYNYMYQIRVGTPLVEICKYIPEACRNKEFSLRFSSGSSDGPVIGFGSKDSVKVTVINMLASMY